MARHPHIGRDPRPAATPAWRSVGSRSPPSLALRAAPDGDRGDRPRRKGPTATAKWLVGSIATTSQQVIAQVFDQANQRDPTHRRRWIVLVDGARWGLQGAEAVLKLRALCSNGDFDAYWQFHTRQEHRRVHQARYQHPLARAA